MSTQTSLPDSLHSDVFESLVAAIYLDGGMDTARQFIATHVFPYIDESACITSDENYKSQLQHVAQRDHCRTPTYLVLDEEGPDHSKSFLIAARLGDKQFEGAWGRSKKQAEQLAAKNALAALGRLNH
jgi:ribonuclease-3